MLDADDGWKAQEHENTRTHTLHASYVSYAGLVVIRCTTGRYSGRAGFTGGFSRHHGRGTCRHVVEYRRTQVYTKIQI